MDTKATANTMKLKVNGKYYDIDAAPEETLLHVLRDHLDLNATANGCTPQECHSGCTVLVNGKARHSCKINIGSLDDDRIRTLEGISEEHPVKNAWKEEGIQECEVCKSAHILQAISLLGRMLNPSPEDIKEALDTGRCTCGKDPRVIRAVNKASKHCYDS